MRGGRKWLLIIYLVLLHVVLGYLIIDAARAHIRSSLSVTPVPEPAVTIAEHTPEPDPTPCLVTDLAVTPSPIPSLIPLPNENRSLIIPVAGINSGQLVDTFTSARGEGRTHDAIDIMAPGGTPVLAAVTGEIVRFFDSVPGGITIYQLSEDRRFVYYYAHLQRRSDGIKPGDLVTQGTTIGYVGDTGNAGPGNYHLHFSIARVTGPKRYWEGSYLNPYPYLKSGKAPE